MSAHSPHPRDAGATLDLLALCLTPLLILIQGFKFGLGNDDFVLASVRRIIDPAYLVNDWFLNTPPHHPFLMQLLAVGVRVFGEPLLFLLVHLATRFLLLSGTWRLARELAPDVPFVAPLAMVATLFEPRLRVGFHFLQGDHWEAAYLGMALAVWTLALGCRVASGRGSYITLALAAGSAVLGHLFIGLPVAAFTFLGIVTVRGFSRELWGAGLATLLLGSPSWIPAAREFFRPGESPLSAQDVISILQYRHPWHHQPWTWPLQHIVQAMLFVTVAGFAAVRLRGLRSPSLRVPAILLGWFLVSCVLFVVSGWKHVLPILAYLQPFRLFSLFLLIGTILFLELLLRAKSNRSMLERIVIILALLAWGRFASLLGPLVVAGVCAFLLLRRFSEADARETALPRRLILAAGAVGLVGIITLQYVRPARDLANRVRREYWTATVEPPTSDRERRGLTAWVREHTPIEAVFAIPADTNYFRIWERRAVVVDFKSVPYRNADLKEWAARISAVTGDDPLQLFARPGEQTVSPEEHEAFARRYGARYVVTNRAVSDSRVVFRNAVWNVLDLERTPLAPPPRDAMLTPSPSENRP